MPSFSSADSEKRPECIRLRGVRQNNLQGFDLDLPLGQYIVVTGLSGTGKSSLVFDTLHAEGQRRYVETFSAYTRQFLDLLPKPHLDDAENIRPSIAIEQTNTIKTSRSTVGTMTELTDYAKIWFSNVAHCFDPDTGEIVEDDTPFSIWEKTFSKCLGQTLLVAFELARPNKLPWKEILERLKAQAYLRILIRNESGNHVARRVDELLALEDSSAPDAAFKVFVVQDRIGISLENRDRFLEATETALHFGQGELHIFSSVQTTASEEVFQETGHYSRGLHSPKTGRRFRPASPGLFSFNSAIGACPTCRGFGRTIEVDHRLAVPDWTKSINQGAIKCWEGDVYSASVDDLRVFAKRKKIPFDVPFAELTEEQRTFIVDGEPGYGEENGKTWPKYWYGIKGFFRWLEKNTYKMHVRVFLSRYRSYRACPTCGGGRLQPEALCWRWNGKTLPDLFSMPASELLALLEEKGLPQTEDTQPGDDASADSQKRSSARATPAQAALDAMLTRLRYLVRVGVGYLTLDRSSRTLSGGEVERVNLTTCLGTSLVDTLFVLDEPSVGLHPRDIDRLIGIIRTLTNAGNTVVVVEHDEAMIRAADHVVELGPRPGSGGGRIVFSGTVADLLRHPESITGAYLSGRADIPLPSKRRPVATHQEGNCLCEGSPALHINGATKHNLLDLSVSIPLRRFVALSGVSGSGKSTLLEHVLHQGLLTARRILTEDPASVRNIKSDIPIGEIVLVDQSPLSRTPRSNPALYSGAWDRIRTLYASTPQAKAAGFSQSSFSFNGGDGRCEHCKGLGSERIEMQFLADVFVPCPICEGKRFKPEVLAIRWRECSIADLLSQSIDDAIIHFNSEPRIVECLQPLAKVGLGYLTLGQPLNTLSGGEAQRLKLVRFLGGIVNNSISDSSEPETSDLDDSGEQTGIAPQNSASSSENSTALLLLDEPTTGLHRHDVRRLLGALQSIVDQGHSLVVIEHNLDVLKSADWIIEIGPEAGSAGGRIVAEGTPEDIALTSTATASYLRRALAPGSAVGEDSTPHFGENENAAPLLSESQPSHIVLVGARENNLRDVSLRLPHRSLNVVTGVSGSGKSTLAFDIIFAEGQRRFMESMSAYARQFVEQLPRPALDRLTGIPPTVAIEQRITRGSRKSTVATITEVAQYLRLLYAKLGIQFHPDTDRPVEPLSIERLRKLFKRTLGDSPANRARHLYLCAPLIRGRKGHHQPIATWIVQQGYKLMRADGRLLAAEAFVKLDRYKEHDIEVVIADLKSQETPPLDEILARALELGKGTCFLLLPNGKILAWFSTTRTDGDTGESFPELDPKHFSHNSPRGWCPTCRGLGRIYPWMLEDNDGEDDESARRLREFGLETEDDLSNAGTLCPDCRGARLNRVSRAVKLRRRGRLAPISLPELLRCTPGNLRTTLAEMDFDERAQHISADILDQIDVRLRFLEKVGLGYLSMERGTDTLSGGEAQRIRLAAQLGSNLAGVLYVLDEPSIGLHAADNRKLIGTLENLRDKGNTLLVVEHDDEVMEHADHIVDLGPGAGRHGGEILAEGTPEDIKNCPESITGVFLAHGITHPLLGSYRPIPTARKASKNDWLQLKGARLRNLAGFDLRMPCGRLILVAGPSGAGKSTLVSNLLQPATDCSIKEKVLRLSGRAFLRHNPDYAEIPLQTKRRGHLSQTPPPPFDELTLPYAFRSVISVDQAPIGKTPRSTPATYLGIFDLIRPFFANLPEARMRGWTASRFSFNTPEGRCPTCEGAGRVRYEMAFMPDSFLPCDDCGGLRYRPDLSEIVWKNLSIGQVLNLSFEDASSFFDFHSQIGDVCRLMVECGLGYLTLGQSSPTLSGGEAQRLKLVYELAQGLPSFRERSRGLSPKNLYLLEEPTIGLHSSDCEKLIRLLHRLVDQGHTVVVIEHNLDLIAEADWVIELGPGGGPDGGSLIYQGPLNGLLKVKNSPTAPFLQGRIASASKGD